MNSGLGWIDALVILALMAGVTWLGHRLSGSISDRRAFFQADGGLPWWAVSASVVATLVSSVTFISVPAAVFRDGGNLTYFQVVIGLAIGKLAIAWLLAKPFYLSTGINSTYGYIGARMDRVTGELSMLLGLLLNVINSGVKLLTASLVLDVITGWGLPGCTGFMLGFALLWSVLAGIKTVIWTDFLLFILFALGAVFALIFMGLQLEGSIADNLQWLDDQARLVLFDFDTDPTSRYTIWAGVLGAICLSLAQGSTQGTWQRVRACRSLADAYRAYNWAAVFYVLHLVILGVGLALVVFYHQQGLPSEVSAALVDQPDRIFPYFIATELPTGVAGLFIAAIFAAAISTLDSTLTESADLTVSHIYERFIRPGATEQHYLFVARCCLVLWGVVFFGVALFFSRYSAEGLLDLTFKLPNYLYGVILATILLARLGIGRWTTFLVGVVVACTLVAWLSANQVAFFYWSPVTGAAMFFTVWGLERSRPLRDPVVRL